jgi:hypothetical protein
VALCQQKLEREQQARALNVCRLLDRATTLLRRADDEGKPKLHAHEPCQVAVLVAERLYGALD